MDAKLSCRTVNINNLRLHVNDNVNVSEAGTERRTSTPFYPYNNQQENEREPRRESLNQ